MLAVSPAAASPRRMRLVEAVAEALRQNLQIQQARAKLDETEESRRATRGNFGPSLSLDASVLVWNDKLEFAMSSPGPDVVAKHGPVLQKYADLMTALPDLFSFGAIREQVTGTIAVTASQPLTPLYQVAKGYQAAKLGSAAARLELTAAEEGIVFEVTRSYIGLKQASAGVEIAKTATEQLRAHVRQAQIFARAGMIAENEVLKADLALAEAKQQLILIQASESLAQSALALHLGLSPAEVILPIEAFADPPPKLTAGLDALVATAFQNRPELRAFAHRVQMAHKGKEIARWDLVPQLAAVATYQHNEGQGVLMPKNTFFVGGALKWKVWDWGTTYYNGKVAAQRVTQAEIGHKQLRDGVYLEVKKAYLDVGSADQSLEATRTSVAQAEENFRVERAKFDKNSNTTTDVLDAQLALTRAKLSHSNALHQWYAARAAVSKAIGGARPVRAGEPRSGEGREESR
jgi:outer membrane protein